MPGVGAAAWLALQAHLPADILWENMSTRFFSRVLRVMFTWLCTVVLLLLSATIIYLMQNAERNAGSTHACGSVIMVTTACTALRDGDYMALATCFADGRALGQRAFLNATTGVNYVVECALVDCYECHCGAPAAGAPSLLTTPTCRPYLLGVAKDSVVRCAPIKADSDAPWQRAPFVRSRFGASMGVVVVNIALKLALRKLTPHEKEVR